MTDTLLTGVLPVVGVIVGAAVLIKLSGLILRRMVRRLADASRDRPARFWRNRVARAGDEPPEIGETRRRQRVDAAARGVNHLVAVVVWIIAIIIVFNVIDIQAAYFMSSAGFIGVAVAFGAAQKVNDYFTGLSVLFEDRYGVGDDIEVTLTSGNDMRAVVEHVGLVTTRLRDERGTYHVANGEVSLVRNHSQDPRSTRLRINVDPDADADHRHDAMRAVRNQAGSSQLTDVFFIGDLDAEQTAPNQVNVDVKTIKPLDARAKRTLEHRVETALRSRR